MHVRIYQPAKNAMQSGKANVKSWRIEPILTRDTVVDPLMGWTGGSETAKQLQLSFSTQEAAIEYAKREGLHFTVIESKPKKTPIRAYAENFTNPRL